MNDFIFPLTQKQLHRRYDPIFKGLKRGLSSSLIGLPLSSRSAYLKFILSQNQERSNFLSQFIDPQKFRFVFLDDSTSNHQTVVKELAVKMISQNIFSEKVKKNLENYLASDDYYLLSSLLLDSLATVDASTKIIIILYQAEKQLLHPETVSLFYRILQINRSLVPDPLFRYLFIGSPLLLELKDSTYLQSLKLVIEENIQFFPLFDNNEMKYTWHRISNLIGKNIDPSINQIASYLSGGHYVLYRTLINLPENELLNIKKTGLHSSISNICNEIWQSLPSIAKLNWRPEFIETHPTLSKLLLIKKGKMSIPLLPPKSSHSEKDPEKGILPQLTGQEKLIFDYLFDHLQQIIKRDEVAQVIWGRAWQKKYSDWAIDRTMSNLRKKLQETKWYLISIRNRGYKLGNR